MSKLAEILSILEKLEELNKEKFNSSEFDNLNKNFEKILVDIVSQKETLTSEGVFSENKNLIMEIISKIEVLEDKIIPKAEIINSFSKSLA
ncbi:MAG: hypothetical protein ISQ89_04295 [Alphaproteobacteria bacterium]|jgi:hypothetical protein|nr:hypothetical protein [Alphaproteobacteria bacterium]